MEHEYSYGIIPLKKEPLQILMIHHRAGHWTLPKGRIEEGEDEIACAMRELLEETHLEIDEFLEMQGFQETYTLSRDGVKKEKFVIYFPAFVCGEIQVQEEEVQEALWMTLDDAITQATYENTKQLLIKVKSCLPSS